MGSPVSAATGPRPLKPDLDRWQTARCPLRAAGTHDVYLQVTGGTGEIARIASLRFAPHRR